MSNIKRRRGLAGLLAVFLLVGLFVFGGPLAGRARAAGTYDNAAIADKAMSYWPGTNNTASGAKACQDAQKPGDSGGQCRAFVNCIVWMVSAHTQNLGGTDYFSPFLKAGGTEIMDVNALIKGDIVQKYVSPSNLHTFIIVSRANGNTFNVVDSNYSGNETVWYHPYSVTLSSTMRAFRMGVVTTTGVGTRLLADVNNDGRADAVVVFRDSGTAMVALAQSNNTFAAPSSWAYGEAVVKGADKYFLADVNGDGQADLVSFRAATGDWYVDLSNGHGFWPATHWASGQGVGTAKQFLADVNGDGKADMVTFDSNTGDWWVSLSNGSGFWPPQRWISGHGVGSTDQFLADFTGDGKADAAVYFASSGAWYVAASNGNGFNGYSQWSAGHGLNSNKRFVGDVAGQGKAAEAFFFTGPGHWDIGTSSGNGFWAPTAWADGQGVGTTDQFLADVNGDHMADMVTFDTNTGDWWVSQSNGSGFWPPQRWISGHGKGS